MPRKSKRKRELDIARDAASEMAAFLMAWYNKSARLVDATSDVHKIRYMMDTGLKVVGFLQTGDAPVASAPSQSPAKPDAELTRRAFARLLDKQAQTPTAPPTNA